jgi:hypothetical protein
MRRSFSAITSAATVSLFAVFMLAACVEGPIGPAGPQGAQGDTGDTGPAGADGSDANSTCVDCHDDDTDIKVRQIQWEASKHATGGNFERVGDPVGVDDDDRSCATCHTHEGFTERMLTGNFTTVALVENPSPPNCRTCHPIHTTYTLADLGRSYTASFDLDIDGTTVDFGDGTLCAQCHQPKTPDPLPVLGGPNVVIDSQYWGPHHSTQGGLLGGGGGYEFPETGSNTYDGPSTHGDVASNADGCPTCHMATAYGDQAGGHTMNMAYSYHGSDVPNTAGCVGCHPSADAWTDFDLNSRQTNTLAQLDLLRTRLLAGGLIDASDHVVPATLTADRAGAVMNFLFILEDLSEGVHNPAYSEALLANTLAATW